MIDKIKKVALVSVPALLLGGFAYGETTELEIIPDLEDMAEGLIETGVEAFTTIVTVALPFVVAIGVFFLVYRMVTGRLS